MPPGSNASDFSPRKRQILRRRLLTWFRNNARALPWRGDRDPYRIWISEIMLQQTQVATVVPYFERFLNRYPTLASLAQADEHDVLRLWEGLGYYRRARALCRAARILSHEKHETIPNDVEMLQSLPGFGRYTVGAVLSQAYDRKLPILEANSQRVLCRLAGIDRNPTTSAVQKQLWQLAEALLPQKKVGDFNQALMELGALVCTPAQPNCAACPLKALCSAQQQGRQHEIPMRASPAGILAVEEVAVVVRKGSRFLLVQRPDAGRWAGMWEFPHHEVEWMESQENAAQRLLAALGIAADVGGPIATIRHSVTRFRITMTCLHVMHRRGVVRAGAHRDAAWVRLDELHAYPLSTPQRRLANRVLAIGLGREKTQNTQK